MPFFIDRRQNPKGKSIGNRRRFLARARERIKAVVDQSVKDRKITDIADGDVITIPTKGIEEPRFHHGGKTGHRTRVLPGLTGLAQVSASYAPPPEAKLRHDLEYIRTMSIWLDTRLIFKSVFYSLFGRWDKRTGGSEK